MNKRVAKKLWKTSFWRPRGQVQVAYRVLHKSRPTDPSPAGMKKCPRCQRNKCILVACAWVECYVCKGTGMVTR